MTYKEIQDAVLFRRFPESRRASAQTWINHRYWWIWTLEDWVFTEGEANVSVTAGSKTLSSVPTDVRTVFGLQRSDGEPLMFLDYRKFNRLYYGQTISAPPQHWTRVAGTFYVGPNADVTAADYKLLYRKEYTKLVNDNDVPLLPEGSHLALVQGGGAEGRKLESDPMYLAFDTDFNATVGILKQSYLVDQRGDNPQWGSYRGGQGQWGAGTTGL